METCGTDRNDRDYDESLLFLYFQINIRNGDIGGKESSMSFLTMIELSRFVLWMNRFIRRTVQMKKYGYIRVSTKEQNPERQFIALKEQGISEENIYLDRISGKDFQRPQYQKLLAGLKRGDALIIKSIDRLGRNYGEILEQWRIVTKEIGADIQVVDLPLLNTNFCHGDLTGIFISDLVLQILAYVAETERVFIRQRQAEGIAAAKARGIKFGCRKVETPEKFEEYFQMWEQGMISTREAAADLHMSHSTFYRRCCEKLKSQKKIL